MAAWEYIMLGVAALIALSSLAQLMRAKRARLIAELERQAEAQRQQSKESNERG